jgi:NADH dehydrogenase
MTPNIPNTGQKRIVIIGGGFAGIALARKLHKTPYQVVLLDKNNYHQFQPLLYQVSTSSLEANAISFPFRKIFHNYKNTVIRMCEVEEIITKDQIIKTSIGDITYDELVIAIGTTNNFFGNKNIAEKALSMKSVSEALLIRNTFLENLELALLNQDPDERKGLLNIVIVGGGPTGTEIAGTLAELQRNTLPKDYPEMNFSDMKIHLIEGSPNVLNSMAPVSKLKAHQYLDQLGVDTRVNTTVKDFDGRYAYLSDGTRLRSNTLIWAAGVTGNTLNGIDPSSLGRGNRFIIDEYFRVKGYQNIYAIGDIAMMVTEAMPMGHPQLAAVAMAQGKTLSENFKRKLKGDPILPFKFLNKGVMATVGRNRAVVELPFFNFQGFFAWLTWMFVHLFLTLGVKNRIIIFINWTWSYFTQDESLRLIIRPKIMKTVDTAVDQ